MAAPQMLEHQRDRNPQQRLSLVERGPKLSSRGLTILLILMVAIPTITVFLLFYLMPPVFEGKLEAKVSLQNVPPGSYYKMPVDQRPEIESAMVVVENISDVEWTNFYVRVNHHYNTFDTEAIPPKGIRSYRLDRFIAKIGAVLDVRQVQVKNIEIYARVPSGARYTFDQDF